MEKPKVFRNNINKNFSNNKNVYYYKNEIVNTKNIHQKINDIFASPSYIYKANVEIYLKDKTISKRIIGRNKDYLITMDNDLIRIDDIIDINTIK